jgi:hypothetical protein
MQPIEWRPVVGYEGLYEVSNTGQIKRVGRGHAATPGRILKQQIHANGYPHVGLHDSGARRTVTVHGVVARAFHGLPELGQEVRHLDGNSLNCSADNLAWGTHSENELDTVAHGTHYSYNRGVNFCRRGHEFTTENTHTYDGRRICRSCRNQAARTRRAENRKAS